MYSVTMRSCDECVKNMCTIYLYIVLCIYDRRGRFMPILYIAVDNCMLSRLHVRTLDMYIRDDCR